MQPQTILTEHLCISAGLQMGAQTCLRQGNPKPQMGKAKAPHTLSNFCYIESGDAVLAFAISDQKRISGPP